MSQNYAITHCEINFFYIEKTSLTRLVCCTSIPKVNINFFKEKKKRKERKGRQVIALKKKVDASKTSDDKGKPAVLKPGREPNNNNNNSL